MNDNVRIWDIASDPLSYINNDVTTNIPVSRTNLYETGQLYKNVSLDETGNAIVEYKDKEGKIILKKVQVDETMAADYSGYAGFLCTYYIYDDLNQLRFVIPPKAVEAIKTNWIFNNDIINELCFRYEYDARQRMIAKKVPGSGWIYMVYDVRDRLVFTQDANSRNLNQWMATLYDQLNRPVITGIISWSGSPSVLQATVTSQTQTPVNPNTGLTIDKTLSSSGTGEIHQALRSVNMIEGFESAAEFTAEIVQGPGGSDGETTIVENIAINKNPLPAGVNFVALTMTYYDNYDWTSKGYSTTNNTKLSPGNNLHSETLPSQASTLVRGMVTGIKTRILEDPGNLSAGIWLSTVSFYDEKGRVIQIQSDNYNGGTDIVTSLYDFSGKVLSTYQVHYISTGPELRIKTNMEYDHAGRLLETWKVINDEDSKKTLIVKNEYDDLGQLRRKELGRKKDVNGNYTSDPLEKLDFTYNIRGWLKGINKYYANNDATQETDRWFGMELAYDWGFALRQYNGNITGTKWRSKGDGVQRAYGFSYDKANRLMAGDFSQGSGGSYADATINFDMQMGDGANANSAYDENGNIKAMKQWGLKLTGSDVIDDMTYSYFTNSNKLKAVTEQGSAAIDNKLGDFTDRANGSTDYGYDKNGNLIVDLNKRLNGVTGTDQISGGAISYNHLNLPYQITVKDDLGNPKGTITYTYDAGGNKIKKVTLENPTSTNNNVQTKTTTLYISGIVYESKEDNNSETTDYTDKLQYFAQEEGRVRATYANTSCPNLITGFEYDYMIKDHLGNVRMVLTTENRTDMYPAATMESASSGIENSIYAGLNETRVDPPSGYPANTPSGNAKVAKVSAAAGSNKVGPAITLKVMAGDKFNVTVNSWWKSANTPTSPANPLTDLVALLNSSVGAITATHGGATIANLQSSNVFTPSVTSFLNNQTYNSSKPKAYLNWVLFDEQFNYVANSSGFEQVGNSDAYTTHTRSNLTIAKSGYLYIYVSNVTDNIDVFFDNLQATHIRGPLLEEMHYYPFGLVMSGISSKALNNAPINRKKFNSIEHTTEFDLNTYDAFFRNADPQIGRWWQIDPKPNEMQSPYSMMGNNPIRYADPLGDTLRFTSAQIQNQSTVNNVTADLQRATGLTLSIDANGNLTYATTTNSKGKQEATISKDANGKNTGSKSARKDLMKAINSSKTVDVFAQNNIGSKGGGLQVNIDAVQVNKFIAGTSSDLNNFTQGFGMTFLHELQHTDIFGGKSDPAKQTVNGQVGVPFGDIGGPETRMNKVRRELNQQGMNLGQRLSYGPMPMGTAGMVYLPFGNRSLNDINSGTIPASMMISYIP